MIPVLIMGKSGSGKSTSMRNFRDDEILIIQVEDKPLPFRTKLTDVVKTSSYKEIGQAIMETKKKVIVIDDAGYLLTTMFMKGHSSQGAGNEIFNFYNKMADRFWVLIEGIKAIEGDTIVYLIMHEDKNDFGDIKPKTIGKLLDDKVCIEGLFTIVLRSVKDMSRYVFKTKTDGLDVTKTPLDMFATEEVDNDLYEVTEVIREYYGMEPLRKEEEHGNA